MSLDSLPMYWYVKYMSGFFAFVLTTTGSNILFSLSKILLPIVVKTKAKKTMPKAKQMEIVCSTTHHLHVW